jgi:hypothetical protein
MYILASLKALLYSYYYLNSFSFLSNTKSSVITFIYPLMNY